jgi:hypothetical protein
MLEAGVDILIMFDVNQSTKVYFRSFLRMRRYAKCNTGKSYTDKLT